MYKKLTLILILTIIITSCNSKKVDFKNGTFKIVINDSITSFIERDIKYQLEYIANTKKKEIYIK